MNELVLNLADRLLSHHYTLATAESCTGGWLGRELTAVSGSSQWYEGGVISYSNSVKQNILQVPEALLNQYGAVSEQVALAMASGVQNIMQSHLSVAITGVAGPGGGTPDKPVGTVWIAWCIEQRIEAQKFVFQGEREEVRKQAVHEALHGLMKWIYPSPLKM